MTTSYHSSSAPGKLYKNAVLVWIFVRDSQGIITETVLKSMTWCKTAVTPLSYCSLAPSHRNDLLGFRILLMTSQHSLRLWQGCPQAACHDIIQWSITPYGVMWPQRVMSRFWKVALGHTSLINHMIHIKISLMFLEHSQSLILLLHDQNFYTIGNINCLSRKEAKTIGSMKEELCNFGKKSL